MLEQGDRLRQQNVWLQQQVTELRLQNASSQDKLIKDFQALIRNFSNAQRDKFEDIASSVERVNEQAIDSRAASSQKTDATFVKLLMGRSQMQQFVTSGLADAEQRREDNLEVYCDDEAELKFY